MHLKNFSHIDIKVNNILLKLKEGNWIPEAYRSSASQTEKYNKKYPHLTYKLCNVFGAKASFESNVYSLGYIFKYLPIKISYQILISKMVEDPFYRVGIIYVVNTLRETVSKSVQIA